MTTADRSATSRQVLGLRLIALALGQIVSWGVLYYGLIVAASRIEAETGWPLALITTLYSISLVVSAICGIVVGRLLDRRSPRAVMTLGSVLGVAGFVVVALAPNLIVFTAGWVIVGIAESAVLYQAAFTVITRRHGDRRHTPLLILTLAGGLASTIFAPVTAGLLGVLDWHGTFLVLAGILAVVTIPVHWFSLEARWPPVEHERPGAQHTVASMLREPRFWFLELSTLAVYLALYSVTLTAIPVFTERGMSFDLAALALGLIGAGQVAGRLLFVAVPKRTAPWVVLSAVGLLSAISLLLLGVVPGPVSLLIVLGVLAGAIRGAQTLVNASAVADRWGTSNYGAINGVFAAPVTILTALAPAIGPLVAAAVGTFSGMALVMAGVALVGAIIARWS
jgi:MFS family permease